MGLIRFVKRIDKGLFEGGYSPALAKVLTDANR